MGMDYVWAVKMNCFRFEVKGLIDRSVNPTRNTFSPRGTGGSVENKSDDCWILDFGDVRTAVG